MKILKGSHRPPLPPKKIKDPPNSHTRFYTMVRCKTITVNIKIARKKKNYHLLHKCIYK